MVGKIPHAFIDELVSRVDLVEVIDRRVPLTRKGKEFQASCPFHDEKTPSFTVSPTKQFYHCFGCGAHGTAIGFLMDYANLSFVEAVEELADGVGLAVPRQAQGAPPLPGEKTVDLLGTVGQAHAWFQQQLRKHPDAKRAVAYLKARGLDGKTAASFGMGFAPDSWNDLVRALATTPQAQRQLVKTGLIVRKDDAGQNDADQNDAGKNDERFFDRFRGRIIFPIEDHRGRVVGFGGRIIGDGEPKYLNSPETPLFHKGAELYGLHRARRAIAAANKSIVVEGYMDVVSLAQFGVDNAVATLGTATTRTHLQRLFRLAAEVVFCFDGDRAGRAAAWKALQVSLPEMQDGRQTGFLFLPEGEDPDSMVRAQRQKAFIERIEKATPMPEFLFENLIAEVDMTRLDGKARLVSLAKPLITQLPAGALKDMMFAKLSALSGLTGAQIGSAAAGDRHARRRKAARPGHGRGPGREHGQISPLALAVSLLLQNPQLARAIGDPAALKKLETHGSEILRSLLDKIERDADTTTARLVEFFRDDEKTYAYLQKLAARDNQIATSALEAQFNDTIARLLENQTEARRLWLLEKLRQGLSPQQEKKARREVKEMLDARNAMMKSRDDGA
ncbi:DNA primase [Candidatus Spongiihabitans sp.]|uniref:DNA primase n=1 Tax=Candidatus Spongiihabitans sp. TaxID=3101308 RepID=UPI003C79CCE6